MKMIKITDAIKLWGNPPAAELDPSVIREKLMNCAVTEIGPNGYVVVSKAEAEE